MSKKTKAKKVRKKPTARDIIRRIVSIVSLIGFIACTIALLYPVISDRWNRYRDLQLIAEYNRVIKKSDPATFNDMLKTAEDYNQYLISQNRNLVTDAAYEPDEYYESLLNPTGNGMMCYVEIPKIDVTEPVYHYSTEISLGMGVGHIHGSSLPTGGKNTHSVLTGHRGLPNQKFFSDLDKLEIGDYFYIHILDKTLAYRVFSKRVIVPTDVSGLMIEDGQDLMTLVTCEPYGVNTHRLLLTGMRIPFDEKKYVEDGFVTHEKHNIVIDPAVWVAAGFVLFIVIMVTFTIVRRVKDRKQRLKEEAEHTDESSESPDNSADPPDEATDLPDKDSDPPDKNSDLHDKDSDLPDKDSDIPEKDSVPHDGKS